MANQYLVDIHEYISAKMADIKKAHTAVDEDSEPARASYLDGQLQELKALRQFLKKHYDLPTQTYY